jgi:hypothetical protein
MDVEGTMSKGLIRNVIGAIAVAALWADVTLAAATPQAVASPAGDPAKVSKAAAGKPAIGGDAAPAASASGAGKPSSGTSGVRRLPATGQISTLTAGDDGSVRAGAPLSYVDNGDGTITDRTTGLMWEKKVKLDGKKEPADLHDADNCYAWQGNCATGGAICGADADCGANGPCVTADCQTARPNGLTIFKWVAQLNGAHFAGHHDWRVPNAKELQSIVNYNVVNPAVTPAFHGASCGSCSSLADAACSCTQSNNYWSSTTYALPGILDGAWVVYFANGTVVFNVKTSTYFVRAVRGGM